MSPTVSQIILHPLILLLHMYISILPMPSSPLLHDKIRERKRSRKLYYFYWRTVSVMSMSLFVMCISSVGCISRIENMNCSFHFSVKLEGIISCTFSALFNEYLYYRMKEIFAEISSHLYTMHLNQGKKMTDGDHLYIVIITAN